ncbi:unnamed protein product [Ascophyllum nodosum]
MPPEGWKRSRVGGLVSRTLFYLLVCGCNPGSNTGEIFSNASSPAGLTPSTQVPQSDKCWIFMHLSKAGGSTVKKILFDHWGEKSTTYDSYQWNKGTGVAEATAANIVSDSGWNVAAGGYTEGLRRTAVYSSRPERCKWFTVFRHPISRLVSAYFYCKVDPTDQLCASDFASSRMIDLRTFARHWGNYALRQFAFSLVSFDEVRDYLLSPNGEKVEEKTLKDIPAWYTLKMYLDGRGGGSDYGEIHDAALYDMLQPVQDLLRDRYAAVGILENFNKTLSLFDATLEMPGMNWPRFYGSLGKINVDMKFRVEKHEALKEAWTDSDIKKYLRLDLLLYEHAVDVFHRQALFHGIG